MEEIVLAHPLKTRLIADAQIKTDRLDAQALGTLRRGNLVARAHIPGKATRARTMLRNRLHALLDRQRGLELPVCRHLFGARGLGFLRKLALPEPDGTLLREALALHDLIAEQMRAQEKRMAIEFGKEGVSQRLRTVPGIGPTLAAVLAAEIDTSERFPRADKLCAYAGLVPSAHASGGKVRHGRLLSACNQWLRWAFVEASWVAVGCPLAMSSGPNGSPYFGALYKRQRDRGKKASTAITIIARRMCRIA